MRNAKKCFRYSKESLLFFINLLSVVRLYPADILSNPMDTYIMLFSGENYGAVQISMLICSPPPCNSSPPH